MAPDRASRSERGPWAVLVMVLVMTAAIRARLLDIPLDRDEGEYAYIGQLFLEGVPPFASAYTMKMPGIHAVYAAILSVLGRTPAAIHTGLLVASSAATVLVFLLARRLFDAAAGAAAASAFAALALSPQVFGLAAYAEPFVLVPVLAGALVLVSGLESGRTVRVTLAGALFGLGFLLKQSAAPFAVFGVVAITVESLSRRPVAGRRLLLGVTAFAAGVALPFAATCLALRIAGTLDAFWFWTFRYASTYASSTTFTKGVSNLSRTLADVGPPAVPAALAALAGAVALVTDPAIRHRRVLVATFALCSALAVATGLYFRHQYFVLALPAMALLAALAPGAVTRRFAATPRVAAACAALVVVAPATFVLWTERAVLFHATPEQAARVLYGRNPFPESLAIADYIRRHTEPTDTVAVFGSEPQIYFYAGRRGATGFIYMYPLMEHHAFARPMQELMIRQIEAANPKFAVYVHVDASWLFQPDSERTLSRWLPAYWRRFDRVGVVDIVSPTHTRYAWEDAARTYVPESQRWLAVFRRRDASP